MATHWKTFLITSLSKLLRPGLSAGLAAGFVRWPLRYFAPRRKVALKNLEIALPHSTKAKRLKLLGETYDHLVWTAIEFMMLQRDPGQVLDWVEADNAAALNAASGGAILLTGHVGNWELAAAWVAQKGHAVTAIVQETKDRNERSLIKEMRERVGVHSLSKKEPMTRAVALLRRGEFLGILPDQKAAAHEGIPVPFFGVDTLTTKGAAVFAYLTKKPLIPVFTHRISPCRHYIRVEEPIAWEAQETREETILHITRKVNDVMERMVREAPGQWLAQHRRFQNLY